MEIPDISIPEIYVPDVPEIYSPHYITITKPPVIDVPGCTYQHRDIKTTGNRNLLFCQCNILLAFLQNQISLWICTFFFSNIN